MAALDAKARATAVRLLNKYGKAVSHSVIIEGTYNPITGDVSGGYSTVDVPKAIIEDFNGTDYVSGLVERGDRKLTIAAQGNSEPKPNDQFVVGTDTYTVVAVETVWSGEQAALYISTVRK